MAIDKMYRFILDDSHCLKLYENPNHDINHIEISEITSVLMYSGNMSILCDRYRCIELIRNYMRYMGRIKNQYDRDHKVTCANNINSAIRLIKYIVDDYDIIPILTRLNDEIIRDRQIELRRIRKRQEERKIYQEKMQQRYELQKQKEQNRKDRSDRWITGLQNFLNSVDNGIYNPPETKYGHIGYAAVDNIKYAYKEHCMFGDYTDYEPERM